MALRLAIRRKYSAAVQTLRLGMMHRPIGQGFCVPWLVPHSVSSGVKVIAAAAKARPLTAALLFATTKGVLADFIAQLMVEGRSLRQAIGMPCGGSKQGRDQDAIDTEEAYDWRRTVAMATFSGVYCGLFFYWQFSVLFPRIWPVTAQRSWRSVLSQVAVDNCFFSTCLYMPVFYVTRGAIVEKKHPSKSLASYREDFPQVVSTLLKVWVPAGLVNFSVCPVWFRTPFNSMVSFFYLTFLSVQSHYLGRS